MTTKTRFKPTHEILLTDPDGARTAIAVRLVDGAAYTRKEWEADAPADWARDAEGVWTFKGRMPPFYGQWVTIREWRRRVSHGLRPRSGGQRGLVYAD